LYTFFGAKPRTDTIVDIPTIFNAVSNNTMILTIDSPKPPRDSKVLGKLFGPNNALAVVKP